MRRHNKLACFPGKVLHDCLIFVSKAGTHQSGTPCGAGFTHRHWTSLKILAIDKPPSLYIRSVSDEENRLYKIQTRCQCYKTLFLGR
jgi:hypothetical protein